MTAKYAAVFAFTAANEDELSLKVGDIVGVSKQVPGGWWFGEIGPFSGWFPSNHVAAIGQHLSEKAALRMDKTASLVVYRSHAVKQILGAQRAFLQALLGAASRFLDPLRGVAWLSEAQKATLLEPLQPVAELHQRLLRLTTRAAEQPHEPLGRVLADHAAELAAVHLKYASQFPAAAETLNALCQGGSAADGAAGASMREFLRMRPTPPTLSTCLLLPLDIVGELATLFADLESHSSPGHVDSDATHMAGRMLDSLANTVQCVRLVKADEYAVLHGPVVDWDGPALTSLGQLQLSANLQTNLLDGKCNILLFSQWLVVLAPLFDGRGTRRLLETVDISACSLRAVGIFSLALAGGDFTVELFFESEHQTKLWRVALSTLQRPRSLPPQFSLAYPRHPSASTGEPSLAASNSDVSVSPKSGRKWPFGGAGGKRVDKSLGPVSGDKAGGGGDKSPQSMRRRKSTSAMKGSSDMKAAAAHAAAAAGVSPSVGQAADGPGYTGSSLESEMNLISVISGYGKRVVTASEMQVKSQQVVADTDSQGLQAQVNELMLELASLKFVCGG